MGKFFSPHVIPRLPAWLARGRRSPCRAPRELSRRHPSGWFCAGPESPCAPRYPEAPELCRLCHRWLWRCPLKWHEHTRAHTPLCEYRQNKKWKNKKNKIKFLLSWRFQEILYIDNHLVNLLLCNLKNRDSCLSSVQFSLVQFCSKIRGLWLWFFISWVRSSFHFCFKQSHSEVVKRNA